MATFALGTFGTPAVMHSCILAEEYAHYNKQAAVTIWLKRCPLKLTKS